MESQSQHTNTYPVEVSGWDASDNFFVEKTLFSWVADEKEVRVRCTLRPGCVLFVRLLQPLCNDNFPIAYQVYRIGSRDGDGKSKVSLTQLRPRLARTEESDHSPDPVHAA